MSDRCARQDERHSHELLHDILEQLHAIRKGQSMSATSQAELDTYIETVLAPALTTLETTGGAIYTAVEALVTANAAGEDLTPQLTELQGIVAKLQSDQSQATAFANQLTSAQLPVGGTAQQSTAPAPAPTAAAVKKPTP